MHLWPLKMGVNLVNIVVKKNSYLHSTTMKRHVPCFVKKAGCEPRTLVTKAERYDHCTTCPVGSSSSIGVRRRSRVHGGGRGGSGGDSSSSSSSGSGSGRSS